MTYSLGTHVRAHSTKKGSPVSSPTHISITSFMLALASMQISHSFQLDQFPDPTHPTEGMWQNTRLELLLSLSIQTYIVTVSLEKHRAIWTRKGSPSFQQKY